MNLTLRGVEEQLARPAKSAEYEPMQKALEDLKEQIATLAAKEGKDKSSQEVKTQGFRLRHQELLRSYKQRLKVDLMRAQQAERKATSELETTTQSEGREHLREPLEELRNKAARDLKWLEQQNLNAYDLPAKQ